MWGRYIQVCPIHLHWAPYMEVLYMCSCLALKPAQLRIKDGCHGLNGPYHSTQFWRRRTKLSFLWRVDMNFLFKHFLPTNSILLLVCWWLRNAIGRQKMFELIVYDQVLYRISYVCNFWKFYCYIIKDLEREMCHIWKMRIIWMIYVWVKFKLIKNLFSNLLRMLLS